MLHDCSFSDLKTVLTPLPSQLKLSAHDGVPIPDPTIYRGIVGKLNFLTHTRPDLSYAVQTLSQFMQKPTYHHLTALKHTISYVSTTVGQGIVLLGSDKLTLQAFSDSDWASCAIHPCAQTRNTKLVYVTNS